MVYKFPPLCIVAMIRILLSIYNFNMTLIFIKYFDFLATTLSSYVEKELSGFSKFHGIRNLLQPVAVHRMFKIYLFL